MEELVLRYQQQHYRCIHPDSYHRLLHLKTKFSLEKKVLIEKKKIYSIEVVVQSVVPTYLSLIWYSIQFLHLDVDRILLVYLSMVEIRYILFEEKETNKVQLICQ